ncbi:MAG: vWA domain-containing protein [Planctomycetales bacterium]
MSSLTFQPQISTALWITLALGAAVLLAWYALRRPEGVPRRRWGAIVGLMAAGTAAVLVILLDPTWEEPVPPPAGKPLLTVLVDESASMAVRDVDEGRSRFEAALRIAGRAAADLDGRFDLRLVRFAGGVAPLDPAAPPESGAVGASTDLAGAIAGALGEERPQGQAVLVLSDGNHNAPGGIRALLGSARAAKAMDVPLYTTTLGGDLVPSDLAVEVVRPQELSFVGQKVVVRVRVRQRGRLAASAAVVLIRNGEEVERRTVEFDALPSLTGRGQGEGEFSPDTADPPPTPPWKGGGAAVEFTVAQPHSGLFRYDVRVEPVAGETTEANNSSPFLLRVVDEPVRVLVLEGKPYWDSKFLLRTLAADPSLEVEALVRLSDSRYVRRSLLLASGDQRSEVGGQLSEGRDQRSEVRDQKSEVGSRLAADNGQRTTDDTGVGRVESTAFLDHPRDVLEDLARYQVVMLGRDAEAFLDAETLARLRAWIARDGGSLVCFRGAPVASLGEELGRLLPVRWSPTRETRFRVALTGDGSGMSWFGENAPDEAGPLGKLPSLAMAAAPERPKPLAVVLARTEAGDGAPVVSYQLYGTGRVVAVEGSGMWRWAFLAPPYRELDATYGSLWQSLLRWLVSSVGLAPGQDLALRTDRIAFLPEEPVSAELLVRAESGTSTVPAVALLREDGTPIRSIDPSPAGDVPGVYRVAFGKLPEGRYRARVEERKRPGNGGPLDDQRQLTADSGQRTTPVVEFEVRPDFREQLDVQAHPDRMARIAEISGGAVLADADPQAVVAQFAEHLARSRPPRVRLISAWDRWWVLLGVFALWTAAWGLRRSAGLV